VRKRLIRRFADRGPASGTGTGDASPARPRRGRDRRGRGLRGPLAPPESPLSLTRAEGFNELIRDAVERLEVKWRRELTGVEFAVEAVPGVEAIGSVAISGSGVPLSRLYTGGAGRNARIVLYRRPIEARAKGRGDLAILISDLIVEQFAELLGLAPEAIDPDYGLD
jgi:hypothetical protein